MSKQLVVPHACETSLAIKHHVSSRLCAEIFVHYLEQHYPAVAVVKKQMTNGWIVHHDNGSTTDYIYVLYPSEIPHEEKSSYSLLSLFSSGHGNLHVNALTAFHNASAHVARVIDNEL